ncbi:MAG: glycine/sarcosine/betaine reductase selenoprotein B family protein [Chloroflexota bacterium]
MMVDHDQRSETFEEFKNSFNYGARSDLNFKFLKNASDEDAARFFQELLWKLGDVLTDGDFERIVEHIIDSQANAYAGPGRFVYEDGPFTSLRAPLTRLRLGLMSSSGHFVDGDDPKPFGVENMSQKEAETRIDDFLKVEPYLSVIPMNTSEGRLRVRHGGYDVRGSLADPNVNFPLARLRELQADGRIGELASDAYSFVGATSQLRLLNHTGPEWVRLFQETEMDALLLVPV